MNGAVVAVGTFVVAIAGGEVEAAGDLLVKQGILDGAGNVGVNANGKLADIPRALIGIKNLIAARGVAAGGLDDLSVFEGQARALKDIALIEAGRVVLHNAVHAVAHGRGIDLAVGDVALAVALDGGHTCDGEAQIRAGTHDMHVAGMLHATDQRIHRPAHLCIIQRAYVKVEILKRLGAHARLLGHGRGGIAQHHPARIRHTDPAVHGLAVMLHVQALLLRRHVGLLIGVYTCPQADIGVHGTHAVGVYAGLLLPFFGGRAQQQGALHRHVAQHDDRLRTRRIRLTDQRGHRLRLYAKVLDEHALARLHGARVTNQLSG